MTDKFESWLNAELDYRKRSILNRLTEMEEKIVMIKRRVEADHYLNDLGELQASGVMLDTAIAAYSAERQALKNYQEMKREAV